VSNIVTHTSPALPGNVALLLDEAEVAGLRNQIVAIADRMCGADAGHHIILRYSHALDGIDVSLHCHAPGSTPLIEAHLLSERIERELRAALPQLDRITIYVEPAGSRDN
jgi:divalent metal cation (Fe/Co/Zn/Cd) transporter